MMDRRAFLGSLLALPWLSAGAAVVGDRQFRPVPKTGERLPVIGMGSWLTFDVYHDPAAFDTRVAVLRAFFDNGGAMIDSSPMYGSSEEMIGYCLGQLNRPTALFSATKVWTLSRRIGIAQMSRSREYWGVDHFDLMQVHNLLDWETHLETLLEWKAEGRIRYIGVTTSHGRRHDALVQIMQRQPIDFVQFTYNILDREAEQRLLPMAQDLGIAVIINRPFQRGALFPPVTDRRLPDWAAEIDCDNWAQFFLKFVVSHPAVTCAIPATSRVDHMLENMGAGRGRLPDAAMRKEMVAFFDRP